MEYISEMKDMPPPLCAVAKLWLTDSTPANYQSRIGVNSYQLQFEGLKPFPDANIYITGDTFSACTKQHSFLSWSEGVLLNSERILVGHFGLSPLVPDVPIHNEFPKKHQPLNLSKL